VHVIFNTCFEDQGQAGARNLRQLFGVHEKPSR
jgi:hypothetical protein